MYVVSVKFDVKKIFALLGVLLTVIVAVYVIIPKHSNDVLSSNVDRSAKNTSEHIDFLSAYGYNIYDKPVQIQEIIIPQEFNAEYSEYNDLQKLSGFDLSDYKGCRVKKYTYKVLNYPDSDDEVVASLLIYKDKVIGGDISSAVLGGFVHGFVKE